MADTAVDASKAPEDPSHPPTKEKFWALALGSVGVVFGDIGTSPLYAMREALSHSKGGGGGELAVLGVVSLIIWALILIVTIKYVVFLMRADNKGEGGTLALMALAQRVSPGGRSTVIFVLGMVGAALFYGDGIITPAMSVLSAVEGIGKAPGMGTTLRVADFGGNSDCAVSGAVAGHGQHGPLLRADHSAVVPDAGRAGHLSHL